MASQDLTRSTFVDVRRFGVALPAAASLAAIIALVVWRIAGGIPPAAEVLLQATLIVSFSVLTVVDFRAATAIGLLELGVGGAGGQWTMIAGAISGRNFLDGALVVGAAYILADEWRHGWEPRSSRYLFHALGLGAIMAAVWFPLGFLNGNRPGDVLGDGNAVLFLAFVVVPVALMRQLRGSWLRECLYRVCAANAVVTGVLIAISASGLVALRPALEHALIDQLMFGGTVGYMPNGSYRLYLGSGVFLLVGLALCTWRLLQRPRQLTTWALYALLWLDVVASYTRGFWMGALVAVGVVLLMGAETWRRPAAIAAMSVTLFVVAGTVGIVFGFSLSNYLFQRASTIVFVPGRPAAPVTGHLFPLAALPPPQPLRSEEESPGGGSDGGKDASGDAAGELSNKMRQQQADVLSDKIKARPILGYGFGSIAKRYRYGHSYSYELTYLDLLFKTGFVGLLIFLSFPVRLVVDAFRGRRRRLIPAAGVDTRETSVVVAIVASILLIAGTNPYLLAAFGLTPIILSVAWLDHSRAAPS
jgi:hypothetical protein